MKVCVKRKGLLQSANKGRERVDSGKMPLLPQRREMVDPEIASLHENVELVSLLSHRLTTMKT